MLQDIMEHRISQRKLGNTLMTYVTRMTHRAIARFLEAIDNKLSALIKKRTREKMQHEFDEEEFDAAMKDEQVDRAV